MFAELGPQLYKISQQRLAGWKGESWKDTVKKKWTLGESGVLLKVLQIFCESNLQKIVSHSEAVRSALEQMVKSEG